MHDLTDHSETTPMPRPNLSRVAGPLLATALAIGLLPASVLADEPPVPVAITMSTTTNPVSGRVFNFDPQYPDGMIIPQDAVCQYELRWGDDQSILHNNYNDTFGSTIVRGTNASGYCHGWTLTLPFSEARQWQWDYRVVDADFNPLIEGFTTEEDGYPRFTGTNGAAVGSGITRSDIPGVWLSMTKHASVGSTVTVTAHPFGGYTVPAGGASWMAYPSAAVSEDDEYYTAEGRGLTFSFVPKTVGQWTAFYNDSGNPNFAGAGVDPMVTAAVKTTSSVKIRMSRTVQRRHYVAFKVATSGFKGKVTCSVSINKKWILNGCSGRLRFSTVGTRKVTAFVTDAYGHRAKKTIKVTITR